MNLNPFRKADSPAANQRAAPVTERDVAAAKATIDRLSAICSATTDNFSPRYKEARKQIDAAGEEYQRIRFLHSIQQVRLVLTDSMQTANEAIASCKSVKEKAVRELATVTELVKAQSARLAPLKGQLAQLSQQHASAAEKARADLEAATLSADQGALELAAKAVAAAQAKARDAQDRIETLRIQEGALERQLAELNTRATTLQADLEKAQVELGKAQCEPHAIRLDMAMLDAIDAFVDFVNTGARFDRSVLAGCLCIGQSREVRLRAGDSLKELRVEFDSVNLLARAFWNHEKNAESLRQDPMALDAGKPAPAPLPAVNSLYQPGSADYVREQQEAQRRLHS